MTGQLSFQDAVRRRRSVRKFETGRSIGKDVLARIVDCGRWAPSGANVQCWEFVVVDEPTMREAVTAVFLRQAERLVETLSLTPIANPPGILEGQADFSAPRVAGKATKGRRKK